MGLGGLDRRSRLPSPDGGKQDLLEQRQRPEAPDPPETRLDVQQGGGEPAPFLVRGAPLIDLPDALLHETVQGLETVGGLQAAPHLREEPEAVKGHGLLQPPRRTFSPVSVMPSAMTIWSAAMVLPSSSRPRVHTRQGAAPGRPGAARSSAGGALSASPNRGPAGQSQTPSGRRGRSSQAGSSSGHSRTARPPVCP